MPRVFHKKFPSIFLFGTAHTLALLTIVKIKHQIICLSLAFLAGIVNILFLRKTIKYSTNKKLVIFLKMDKVIFFWEMHTGASRTFEGWIPQSIGLAILICGAIDVAKNITVYLLSKNFFTNDEYKNFKNVLELERYILTCKYGYKEYTDDFIVDYINDNKARHDPRVLFCLWTDHPDTQKLFGKEEAIALVKQKIQEKDANVQIDLCAMTALRIAEAKEKMGGNDSSETEAPSEDSEHSFNIGFYHELEMLDANYVQGEDVIGGAPYPLTATDFRGQMSLSGNLERNLNRSLERNLERNLGNNTERNSNRYQKSDSDEEINFIKQSEEDSRDKHPFPKQQEDFKLREHCAENEDEPLIIHCNTAEELQKLRNLEIAMDTTAAGTQNTVKIEADEYENLVAAEEQPLYGKVCMEGLTRLLTVEDAAACLKILTQDFEDFLRFEQFYDNMRQHNNDRGAFIKLCRSNNIVRGILTSMFLALELAICSFVTTAIISWDDNIRNTLVPLALFTFPTFWYFYIPFLFLVYHKPYDIGDRVVIKGESMLVREIQLCYTMFERWNNDYIVLNNQEIIKQSIMNVKRSNCQVLNLNFYIDNLTSDKAMNDLKLSMNAFVKRIQVLQTVQIIVKEVLNNNQCLLSVYIRHNINHQNAFFMWKAQNTFMTEFVKQCNRLKISYFPLPLRFGGKKSVTQRYKEFVKKQRSDKYQG